MSFDEKEHRNVFSYLSICVCAYVWKSGGGMSWGGCVTNCKNGKLRCITSIPRGNGIVIAVVVVVSSAVAVLVKAAALVVVVVIILAVKSVSQSVNHGNGSFAVCVCRFEKWMQWMEKKKCRRQVFLKMWNFTFPIRAQIN
ncbi:hypothetical protein Tsp_03578 [Trichinella spiralis]|uniref:hypothetical protein n=1 Tax=Trichinella spiralis TaxID=6334 RepID=UPI0001EFB814|nr:hypothetical protein Tsp_03578 [Trichinella spiralis]